MSVSWNIDFGKMKTDKFMAELINDTADLQVQGYRAGFGAEADPQGKKWRGLKAKTVKRKGNAEILIDTGKLLRGTFVSQRATKTRKIAIVRPSKDRQKIAEFHQEGAGNLPVRKLFPEGGRIYKRTEKQFRILVKNTEIKLGKSIRINKITRGK